MRYFLLITSLTFCFSFATAQPGSLDASFANNGIYSALNPYLYEVAGAGGLQADGKILLAGYCQYGPTQSDWLIRRLDADGIVDASYGNSGDLRIDMNSDNENITDLLVLPDGKVIVTGLSGAQSGGFGIAKVNTDGTLDQSFGTAGKVIGSVGKHGGINALARNSNGDFFLAGSTEGGSGSQERDFYIMAFASNGQVKNSFGTNGEVTATINDRTEELLDIAIQPDGKIVAIGTARPTAGNFRLVAMRFNTDGTSDNTFANNGKYTFSVSQHGVRGECLSILGNGNILLGGSDIIDFDEASALVIQLDNAGTEVSSFANNGVFRSDRTKVPVMVSQQLLEQPDGKILSVGKASDGGLDDYGIVRIMTDGQTDTQFGNDGYVQTDLNNDGLDPVRGAFLQPDGKLLVTGGTFTGKQTFGAARYLTGLNTGIGPSEEAQQVIEVYPNPTEDWINVSTESETQLVNVLTIQGQVLQSMQPAQGTSKIDVSSLPPGLYLLEFLRLHEQQVVPFVKQ